ncbi:MAG: hydroxypyruvate isomerase family protein [Woeseiaceae bacterium]
MTNRREILGLSLSAALTLPFAEAKAFNQGTDKALPNYLACNMESWWTELPFLERFKRASENGFQAVEFWSHSDPSRSMTKVANLCESLDLNVIQFTGWQGPSLASLANHKDFIEAIKQAIDIAHQLNAPMFTVVGHQTIKGTDQQTSLENMIRALSSVIPILENAGKKLILEPFNPVDHEGHFLNGSSDALAICRSIASPNIKINWDLYHMQLSEGNLIENLQSGMDQVGYIQVADVPGRNQPGTGEINYKFVFDELKRMQYKGYIGLECWPKNKDNVQAIIDLFRLV